MAKLEVKRNFKGTDYTIGKLYLDGEYFCDTLEDTVRNLPALCPDTPKGVICKCKEKVYAETAIPAGRYKVTIQRSPKFGVVPHVHDVPHFIGILIHSGNDASHTSGCLLVGRNTVKGKVLESKATMQKLMDRINKDTDITLTIG